MMKSFFFFPILCVSILNAFAQKQTYFLFACAQKSSKDICAEKVPIKSVEIQLTPLEAETYAHNYEKELQKDYPADKKFKNIQVSLIKQGNVVIQFEGEKKYTQKEDGWDCTSTFYGIVVGVDDAAAEKKLAALKAEYKRSVYTVTNHFKVSLLQSFKHEDFEVKWVQTKTGVTVFFKNTKKDMALKLVIRSMKKTSASTGDLEREENFIKLNKAAEQSIEVQPGGSNQLRLNSADAFEIDIEPVGTTKEEQPVINKMKQEIRRYITTPGEIREASNMGVRG